METQKSNIEAWGQRATDNGDKYFLDVCDCFSYEHFPVFTKTIEELNERKSYYEKLDMHSVWGRFIVENGQVKEIF